MRELTQSVSGGKCSSLCVFHADDYKLQVQVSNQYDKIEKAMMIKVRPPLTHLLISSSPPIPLVSQPFLLEASPQPSPHGILYTWNFGDGSEAVQGFHGQINHVARSCGIYNITVCANNTLAALTAWITVEVMEEVTGLILSYDGPNELNSVTEFRGQVHAGSSLVWDFEFGDGSMRRNLSDGYVSHVYESPGNYTVRLTVSNSVSQTRQSISVEVYRLTIRGILPSECVMSGREIQLSALMNANVSMLTLHWSFGDGSPLAVVKGTPRAKHTYASHGTFNVNLTLFSSFGFASYNANVCVEARINDLTVQPSKGAVAVGEEVCFSVFVYPEQITGYQFMWFRHSSSDSPRKGNAQKCFVYKEEGVKEVTVMTSNKVSDKTAQATVAIQKPVSKLSVAHGGQSDTLTAKTITPFWVNSVTGTNVSVMWDFGDGSPVERSQNVSHVFTSAGQFTVTVTGFNAVSRDTVILEVNVLLPVSDLSLHTSQPYAVVGEEIVITAVSSAINSTNYFWSVEGMTTTKQGTCQFRYVFPKPGVYQIRVIAQNLVSQREAAVLIEVFERIEGLHIDCQSLTDLKYIPTRENVLFIASLTLGSNITYQWFAEQTESNFQTTGEGEHFQLFTRMPGNISVQLRASNKLGETASHLSIVAIEPVTGASITAESDILAVGKSVNISVTVVTGSDLQYLWYVNSDPSPLQTDEPFLLHTFKTLGPCSVKLLVQNVLSHIIVSKQFIVQEEVGEVEFQIDRKTHPFYIYTGAFVTLYGFVQKGSDLQWDWKIATSVEHTHVIGTDRSIVYTFTDVGVFKVFLNVSNGMSWRTVSHRVTVQDAIRGLTLNVSKSTVCTEEQVVFTPAISKGSNVSFAVALGMDDSTHEQDFAEGHFTISSPPVGTHLVTVKAWNQVSSSEVTSTIQIVERVQGLRLVNCCSTALEAAREIHFQSEVKSGFPVNYIWMFHPEGSKPSQATGQEVIYSSPGSGLLSVSVVASNGVCSQTLNKTATVQWPVKGVKLVCKSTEIFTGYAITFSAKVNGGSNLRFHWDFGDSTEVGIADFNAANHTYQLAGRYDVKVTVFNNVSQVSAQLRMEVIELQCSLPESSLVQGQATILRSRPSYFEASIDVKGCSAYKTTYLWEIFRGSDCGDGDQDVNGNMVSHGIHNLPTQNNIGYVGTENDVQYVTLSSGVGVTSPLLSLPKHALEVGQYCLVFTVALQGTPLLVHRKTKVSVVHSPLVAIIKGGTHRLWPSHSDLSLDGSESRDPDVKPEVEDQLQYHWDFMVEVLVSCYYLLLV